MHYHKICRTAEDVLFHWSNFCLTNEEPGLQGKWRRRSVYLMWSKDSGAKERARTKPQGKLVRGDQVIECSGWTTSQARTGVRLDERALQQERVREKESAGCRSGEKQSRTKLVCSEKEVEARFRTKERSRLTQVFAAWLDGERQWWRRAGRPDQQNLRACERRRGERERERELQEDAWQKKPLKSGSWNYSHRNCRGEATKPQ